jgi:hypothetical protein
MLQGDGRSVEKKGANNIAVVLSDGKVYELGREDNGKKVMGHRNYKSTYPAFYFSMFAC